MVPVLVAARYLHEAYASLDQAPSNQTPLAPGFGLRLIDAIEAVRFGRLLRNVECLLGGSLHLGRQLIAGDASRQVVFARPLTKMILIELLQVIEKSLLSPRRDRR